MKFKFTFILLVLIGQFFSLTAREVTSFNEGWLFKRGPFSEDPVKVVAQWEGKWETVNLPHTWNAKDMQVKAASFYEGVGYYKKKQFFNEELKGKRVFLRFEGVGANTEVYVNSKLVGTHKGGYSAFAFEIGTALKFGAENEIMVKADNTARPDVIPVNHSLFGVYGGIYRPVWLIVTEQNNITVTDCASPGVYITQKNVSKRSADITVKVKLDNGSLTPANLVLENTLYTQEGKRVASHRLPLELTPQGTQTYFSTFKLNKPHLWQGRKDPYLYKVVSRLVAEGRVIDEVIQPLGVRKFEVVAGKGFYLNDEKYPMYGVTRHQDWWGLGSALTNKEHDFDLAQIMDVGATTVRFAHYQQSDYLYSRCDSLGLVIWAEIPFVNRVTGYEAENAQSQLRELIRQSFNHPSIYVWGLHNEVYQPHEYTAGLTQALHNLAKTEDPDRYTVAVNGFGHAEHAVNQNTDIQGMNRYFGWYEKKLQDIEPWVKGLEEKYPWQKLMLTEYGADANLEHQTEYLGDALNWGKPFYPETFQTKTHEYQWSVISKHPYIIASYLWNMFDFAVPMWSRGGLHNEVYQPHEYTAGLTQALHNLAKTEDPDRYTVAVNGFGHAEHAVNQNTDIQGMNRYFGWYEKKLQDIEPWVKGLEEKYPWQKLMLTEYGADANLEHQTEYLGDALNWGKPFYPETFQTKTHEYQWSVISKHPYIIASYLWNMFDFAVPMWSRGGVPARNLKGLMTFDRKIKKDSYYWYKANWSKEPVLYLTQRRNADRERKQTSVTVYSNIGTPIVYLNGKELTGIRKGYTDVHYVFDNVTLEQGKNVIRTVATHNGKEYTDEIEWNYTGEKKRNADSRENKNEHAGW